MSLCHLPGLICDVTMPSSRSNLWCHYAIFLVQSVMSLCYLPGPICDVTIPSSRSNLWCHYAIFSVQSVMSLCHHPGSICDVTMPSSRFSLWCHYAIFPVQSVMSLWPSSRSNLWCDYASFSWASPSSLTPPLQNIIKLVNAPELSAPDTLQQIISFSILQFGLRLCLMIYRSRCPLKNGFISNDIFPLQMSVTGEDITANWNSLIFWLLWLFLSSQIFLHLCKSNCSGL